MLPELTIEDCAGALDSVAAELLARLDDQSPPVDVLALARLVGADVAWDSELAGRGRVVRLRGFDGDDQRPSILLRPEERRERWQWAVAHELGEMLAQQVFEQLSVDPREAPPSTRERVANQLAGRLLLPSTSFRADGASCDWDLLALKRRYNTASHELIARRMLDFTCGVVVTIFDHNRRTFRRGNLPGRLPPWDALEETARREAHERSQIAALGDYRLRVRAWPIHEPDWKREIVRTDWHDEMADAL